MRPKELAVTRVGLLIRDPYAIYAQYILRLRALDPLRPEADAALRGQVLHKILEHPPLKPHIWGGKGVGSQGDGTAQFLAKSLADQQAVIEIHVGVEQLVIDIILAASRK